MPKRKYSRLALFATIVSLINLAGLILTILIIIKR